MNLVLQIIVGIFIGWLASLLVKGKGSGLFADLLAGVLGSFFAGWAIHFFGWHISGSLESLGVSVAGAALLLVVARFIAG